MNRKKLLPSIATGLIVLFLYIYNIFVRPDLKLVPVLIGICSVNAFICNFMYYVKYEAVFSPKDWHEAFTRPIKGQPFLTVLAFSFWKWLILAIFGSLFFGKLG